MPDGFTSSGGQQIAQRGFRGGFPRGGFPRGGFRRFPMRFPIRRRFPRFFFPFFFGFPTDGCFFIDQFGRCCDRFGRCFGGGFDFFPFASADSADSSYGVAGSWDMMADMYGMDGAEGAGSLAAFNDITDYDYSE